MVLILAGSGQIDIAVLLGFLVGDVGEVSGDGVSYSEVWSGESEPQTDTTKYVSTSASARYIKVTAYGNTVSGWNSIGEIEVYSK